MNKIYERYIKWNIVESLKKVEQGADAEKEATELYNRLKILFD